ncbi:MAG: hypothetical protein ETSY1_29000 [Candidatus Entotheonella factor]|uniref:Polyketide cyclase n=1 Tax=Entotheonella factor TaxID=1429438 RepID=W4LCY1_ENTF1|nr:MAG: hypothetical protein ETSY1_29000 [Candidatus Entotheonella factor]
MRMSDGPTVAEDVFINASPATVWALITDLDAIGRWSPEYQGGEWIEGATGPAVGARFKGHNKREDREWESQSIITVCDVERTLAWAVGREPSSAGASWRFELTPQDSGTHVRQQVIIGPGPSGLTAVIDQRPDLEEKIIANRCAEHSRNMQATLQGLKAAAEQGA